MLKKIIIATFIVVIASPGLAKTKVYGELHASYNNYFSVGESARDTIVLNNSIVGVKGAMEIKKDVSFIYQFSWGVSEDGYEGSTEQGINNRNQIIGLASNKGAVIVGRFDTPFKTLGKQADLFWHSQLGQNRNITNANNWDVRADKIVVFQSPKTKGFQSSIAYASDISDTSRLTHNASALSINGFYQTEKFKFGAAYEKHHLKNQLQSLTQNKDALRLSANYKKDRLQLVGFYQQENNALAVTPDANVFGIGIAYNIGAGKLKAQYYIRDIKSSSTDPNLLAIGYDHKWTKQSDVYFQVAQITEGAKLTGLNNTNTMLNTDTDRGLSVGIRYKF